MPLNILDELAAKYGTDKSTVAPANLSAKSYTIPYSQYLETVRQEQIVLLEIGVWGGSSLLMWENYLPNAKIIAIDIDPKCKRFATERSQIFIGDQTDVDFLKLVGDAAGPFDCIIDDGGHRMEHHQASLPVLCLISAMAAGMRSRICTPATFPILVGDIRNRQQLSNGFSSLSSTA